MACIGLRLDPVAAPLSGEAAGLLGDTDLSAEEAAIVAAAWWSAADPQLSIAFGWVHDDVARRYPSLAALRLLLEPYGVRVPLALPTDSGPVAGGWLRPVTDADAPVRLTPTAALLLDGWRPSAEPGGSLPDRLRGPAEQAAALLGKGYRVVVRCADDEDGLVLARAAAARLGRALDTDAERPMAETALLARLGLVLPVAETETSPARLRLGAPGAPASPGWQVIDVTAIDPGGVHRAWRRALAAAGLDPRHDDELAARMRLPETTIDALRRDAEAAAAAAGRPVSAADLHTAVRRHPLESPSEYAAFEPFWGMAWVRSM